MSHLITDRCLTHLGFTPSCLTQPDQDEPHDQPESFGAVVGEAGVNHHSQGDMSS